MSRNRRAAEPRLLEVVRLAWESERRFPIKTVNELRPLLVKAGLHFFKHKKGVTFITRIKLNRFESTTHLSELLQKIVAFLRTHEGATRKQLAANLAPVDETQLASDLHWLIQDGYVVEFHDGKLWALEEKPSKPASAPVKNAATPPVEGGATPAPDASSVVADEPRDPAVVEVAPAELPALATLGFAAPGVTVNAPPSSAAGEPASTHSPEPPESAPAKL